LISKNFNIQLKSNEDKNFYLTKVAKKQQANFDEINSTRDLNKMNKTLSKAQVKLTDYKKRFGDTNGVISNQEKQFAKLNDEISSVKYTVDDLNEKITILERNNRQMEIDIRDKDEELQNALDNKIKIKRTIKDLDDEIASLKDNATDSVVINDAERAVKNLHGELDNIKIVLDRKIQARSQADTTRKNLMRIRR